MKNNLGQSKVVLKHLNFLIDTYHMSFFFQTFDEYKGFYGPINTYSFYNDYGCFSIVHFVQRGEWAWYTSLKIEKNLYDLLNKEICQRDFIDQSFFSYKKTLRYLSNIILKQIISSGSFFGIKIR